MKNFRKQLLWISIFALCSLGTFSSFAKKSDKREFVLHKTECFQHNIQLQLCDTLGFPVPGTEFWVTLDIIKEGPKVTIQLPLINFQTGPSKDPIISPGIPGGYIYTASGYLPEDVRPNDLVYRAILGASNNGTSLPFSYQDALSALPIPPVGYIVQITNAGALVIQCAAQFGNIIPVGPQILFPSDISYIVKSCRRKKVCENVQISTGFTSTTQFTNRNAAASGLRDSHVNDAFGGVVAWAWADNSTTDKTQNILDLNVAIGKVVDGKLVVGAPIKLTSNGPDTIIFDTAIAINRTNPLNIVVSYGLITLTDLVPWLAVTNDGGVTWTNVPLNIPPTGNPAQFGDNRGVAADKFGNFWYCSTNAFNGSGTFIDQPYFVYSTNGLTYTAAYTATAPLPNFNYDYPQYCFGEDGLGNYGLHFVVDLHDNNTFDINPVVGFIPILGLGSIGTPRVQTNLGSFLNVNILAGITAASDGRVWFQGEPSFQLATSYVRPAGLLFKSPGALDVNYAGAWNYAITNNQSFYTLTPPVQDSQPIDGYLPYSVQSIIYDDARQALYAMIAAQFPDYSQNMRIYFVISRDNGQTWSNPLDISNTDFANRGFQSMALDPQTGDLVFGWYDGRNDPTFQSVQYFAALLPACKLDKLVKKIPLSNPLYNLPSATLTAKAKNTVELIKKRNEELKKIRKNTFKGRIKGHVLGKPAAKPAAVRK